MLRHFRTLPGRVKLVGAPRVGVPKGLRSAGGELATGAPDTEAPTITSSSSVSNIEGFVLAHTLTANETVTWTNTGGADTLRFEISGSTLRWLSNGVKDFESPNDADANNIYVVQITATDAALNATNQTISVTVTDIDELAPTITSLSAVNIAEMVVLSHTLTASESVTWTKTGGADIAQFNLSGNILTFTSPGYRDFGSPVDADANNTYIVQVTATDAALNATNQTITFTVTEVIPPSGDAALEFNVDTNSMYLGIMDDPF